LAISLGYSGIYLLIASVYFSLPCSASFAIATPVNVLVVEAILKEVFTLFFLFLFLLLSP